MGIILKLIKFIFVLIWKSGLWGFLLWMTIFEYTLGKAMPKPMYDGLVGAVFGWGLGLVIWGYILINNLVRFFTKDPKFSIIKALLGKKETIGIVADLNVDSKNTISGFVFGRIKNEYVTKKEETDGHILVIGGAGSGKSSCIAIPTLMVWKNRVFAIDIKGELYSKTKKARGIENIKVFNPTDPTANGYNPFYMLNHTDDISGEARSLALSICPLPPDIKDPYWIKSSQDMLTGFILYYHTLECSFSETMLKIKTQPVKNLIAEIMESDNIKSKLEISQFLGTDDKTLSGIFTELSSHITIFATNDDLQRALNGEGDCITPQDLENSFDIFCCIPEYKLEQWKELLGMMCNQFLKAFERREESNQEPILFLIDEFARLGKIDSITNGLATLRSKKIEIALFVQSKSQLNAIYGQDLSEVIADNCSYKAILKASEPNTQEWCSKLVGTYDKEKMSNSSNADMLGVHKGTGVNETTEERRIIKPEEFAYLQDIVCLFPNGYHRIEKAPYYQDSYFENL